METIMIKLPNVQMNPKRKRFVKKAKEQGFELFEYSGRFMYGEYCPAIQVDYLCEFKGYEKFNYDQLGKGAVIYAK